jgi:hypothetical protein
MCQGRLLQSIIQKKNHLQNDPLFLLSQLVGNTYPGNTIDLVEPVYFQ